MAEVNNKISLSGTRRKLGENTRVPRVRCCEIQLCLGLKCYENFLYQCYSRIECQSQLVYAVPSVPRVNGVPSISASRLTPHSSHHNHHNHKDYSTSPQSLQRQNGVKVAQFKTRDTSYAEIGLAGRFSVLEAADRYSRSQTDTEIAPLSL